MDLDDPVRILMTDDTPVMTKLMGEQLKREFGDRVECWAASSGAEALQILSEQKDFDLLVSDLEMPEMNGLELLRQAHELYPELMLILLSGFADLENVTDALNEFGISNFITKPWNPSRLFVIIENAISKILLARENTLLHESQEKSFLEILSVLTDVVNELSPLLSEHARNVASYAVKVGHELGLDDSQMQNVEIAANLHTLGLLGMPKEVYSMHQSRLTGELRTLRQQHPEISAEMLKSTPRLADVREIIRLHQENVDGSGPLGVKRKQLPLESMILRVCSHFDEAVFLRGEEKQEALNTMNHKIAAWFDRHVLKAFMRVITREIETLLIPVSIEDLQPGMKLGRDVNALSGRMVLASGATITNLNLKRLRIYNELDPLEDILIIAEH